MIPIYEQGHGQGIGHSYESFLRKFIDICENHLESKRAKSFAFILYDFRNEQIKEILKNQGGFAKLDRLSGNELSVFYIHSDSKPLIKSFNQIFISAFEIEQKVELPFVLFFKVSDGDVEDVKIVELEQDNLMFAFQELYITIKTYIEDSKIFYQPKANKLIDLVGRVKRISVNELIKWVIEKGLDRAENTF